MRVRLLVVALAATLAVLPTRVGPRPAAEATAAAAAAARPAPADLRAGNLLVNPGFEDGFSLHGSNELVVADGWTPWFDDRLGRPEYKDEPYVRVRDDGGIQAFSLRVFHGRTIQKLFTSFRTHDAGMYQQVRVEPGQPLRFGVWAQSWSSDCDDPCVSPRQPCRPGSDNSHGTYEVQVGIDPTGAVPERLGAPPPDSVVWAAPIVFEAYDGWFRLTTEGLAAAETVTVYTRGRPVWPVKHNDSHWDDARLEVVAPAAPQAHLPYAARRDALRVVDPTVPPVATEQQTQPAPSATSTAAATEHPTDPAASATSTEAPPATPTDQVPSPSPTEAPTHTPLPATATSTAEPTPESPCIDRVANGGFESGDLTGWSAGPEGPAMPEVTGSDVPVGGGEVALRVGVTSMVDDLLPSWSWADQAVAVPADAVTVTLEADVLAVSDETTGGDWQMVALRDASGRPMRLAFWQPGVASAGWQHVSLTLDAGLVAGRTVRLSFEVYNDGDGAPTALYADNVRLVACRAGASAVSVHEPVPPGADIRIDFPIRAFPGQEHFNQPTCDELAFESLIIHNNGVVPVAMDGWTLRDLEGNAYTFPAVTLGEDERVRLWSQAGADTTDGRWTDVYWRRGEPVWNNAGPTTPWDVAVLSDDAGTEVARRGYP